MGEYTGVIPDADGLCARSYTDCNNPEVMFYTVYSCNNQTEVSFLGDDVQFSFYRSLFCLCTVTTHTMI